MDHIAIMKPSWRLIPKILSGEKTIESRWYQTRRAPWNGIAAGDVVYFKDSGKPVTAKADVAEVFQFELRDLEDARKVVAEYGAEINLVNPDPATWRSIPRYAVLIRLRNPQAVTPFQIDKRGFGSAAAWLSVGDIGKVRIV